VQTRSMHGRVERATGSYGSGATHVRCRSLREEAPMLAPPSLLTSLSPSSPLPRDLMRPCTSFTLVKLVALGAFRCSRG